MKETNKQRSARQAVATTALEIDVKGMYSTEAERGDFKRRKMTVFTGYAIFLIVLLIALV